MSTLQPEHALVDHFTGEDLAFMSDSGPSPEQLIEDARHDIHPSEACQKAHRELIEQDSRPTWCEGCEALRTNVRDELCPRCWASYEKFLKTYRQLDNPKRVKHEPRIYRAPTSV